MTYMGITTTCALVHRCRACSKLPNQCGVAPEGSDIGDLGSSFRQVLVPQWLPFTAEVSIRLVLLATPPRASTGPKGAGAVLLGV